jgi:hypothetical protein
VGWFAIACVLGFSVFAIRRSSAILAPSSKVRHVFALILVILGLVVTIWLFITWFFKLWTFGQVSDVASSGVVARVIFGFVLGFGAAYFIEQQSTSSRTDNSSYVRGAQGGAPREEDREGDDLRKLFFKDRNDHNSKDLEMTKSGTAYPLLSIGLGVLLLALAAPHLDRWLSHLTTVKAALVELQLASVTTHKVTVAESTESFNEIRSIENLSGYSRRIRQDIQYLEKFTIPDQAQTVTYDPVAAYFIRNSIEESKDIATQASELLNVFDGVISPIAGCVQAAIKNGLSTETVRQMIRPIAASLNDILFGQSSSDAHQVFWSLLVTLPEKISTFLDKRKYECQSYPVAYASTYFVGGGPVFFPEITKYSRLPICM